MCVHITEHYLDVSEVQFRAGFQRACALLPSPSLLVLLCPRVWTSLENGQVAAWPPGPPVEGTMLQYSCLSGFILVGRNSTLCTKLGKWDSPKPVCHCECLPLRCMFIQGQGCGCIRVYVCLLNINHTR